MSEHPRAHQEYYKAKSDTTFTEPILRGTAKNYVSITTGIFAGAKIITICVIGERQLCAHFM